MSRLTIVAGVFAVAFAVASLVDAQSAGPTGRADIPSVTGPPALRAGAVAGTRYLTILNPSGNPAGPRIVGDEAFWRDVARQVETAYPTPTPTPEPDLGCSAEIIAWSPASLAFTPLSDADAEAAVCDSPEQRPANVEEVAYRPIQAELDATMGTERNRFSQLISQWNPHARYVTGRCGSVASTDDALEWAANKWGVPEDWVRAQAQNESNWNMDQLGDSTLVADSSKYPAFSRIDDTRVYQSLGIMQIRWNHPDKDKAGIGSEPLRWKSVCFNADYTYAQIRYYFDGLCSWCDDNGLGYTPGLEWESIGMWYSGAYPPSSTYVEHVKDKLAARAWAQPGF